MLYTRCLVQKVWISSDCRGSRFIYAYTECINYFTNRNRIFFRTHLFGLARVCSIDVQLTNIIQEFGVNSNRLNWINHLIDIFPNKLLLYFLIDKDNYNFKQITIGGNYVI